MPVKRRRVRVPCHNSKCKSSYHWDKSCPNKPKRVVQIQCTNPDCPDESHPNQYCPLLKKAQTKVPCDNPDCPNKFHWDKPCPRRRVPESKAPEDEQPKASFTLEKMHRIEVLPRRSCTIINVVGSSADTIKDGWRNYCLDRMTSHPTRCSVDGCPGDFDVGGHVLIKPYDDIYFILPLCYACNRSKSHLDYEWFKTRQVRPLAVKWSPDVPKKWNTIDSVTDRPKTKTRLRSGKY